MRDLSSIKAVFFDFDDTLAIHDPEFETVDYWEKVWAQPDMSTISQLCQMRVFDCSWRNLVVWLSIVLRGQTIL